MKLVGHRRLKIRKSIANFLTIHIDERKMKGKNEAEIDKLVAFICFRSNPSILYAVICIDESLILNKICLN